MPIKRREWKKLRDLPILDETGVSVGQATVFGQLAEDIAQLAWNDVTITEELATIQFGTIQTALPEPFAQPWPELAADPGHDLTASYPNTA
ncbi:hypothetical protein [Arthrobacter sp. GAS37]|uniref:hypothetical protein n=1 Tax=Arthrobacter sp. GAS37 TaxID=3156261 RepID=UPI0038517DC8